MSQAIEQWKLWWAARSPLQKIGPVIAALAYWWLVSLLGTLSPDHILPMCAILALYYAGPRTRSVFEFFLPLVLMGMIYDSQRYYADYIRGPIHVREPYEFDMRFFSIQEGATWITLPEWFQIHNHWILDLVTGFFYIAFIPIYLCIAAYFRFYLSRIGTAKQSASYIRTQSPQMMWAFLWLNIIGFSTYYWYAASPPWYAQEYGFGPARTDIGGSAAGCARFDALLGTQIFDAWYGRAADVHGAIPSLHIGYPLLAVYYAFKFGALRATSVQYFLWLCFAAVYLNQHYVLDILVGCIYALAVAWLTDKIWNRSWATKPSGSAAITTSTV